MQTPIEHIFSELRISLSLPDTEKIDAIISESLTKVSELIDAERGTLFLDEIGELPMEL